MRVGKAERTVRHWLARGGVPDYRHGWPHANLIDPCKGYLLERWHQGCQNVLQLVRELQAKGYRGSQQRAPMKQHEQGGNISNSSHTTFALSKAAQEPG